MVIVSLLGLLPLCHSVAAIIVACCCSSDTTVFLSSVFFTEARVHHGTNQPTKVK